MRGHTEALLEARLPYGDLDAHPAHPYFVDQILLIEVEPDRADDLALGQRQVTIACIDREILGGIEIANLPAQHRVRRWHHFPQTMSAISSSVKIIPMTQMSRIPSPLTIDRPCARARPERT